MICTYTVGTITIDLAGGAGRTSETKRLRIQTAPAWQGVAYVGGTEGRQFNRPGSMTNVSFQSVITFSSVADAQLYILSLPRDQISQEDGSAILGVATTDGTAQVETATAAGTVTLDGNVTVTVTGAMLRGSPLTFQVAVLNTDTASQWAAKVRTALNADAEIRRRFTVGGTGAEISLASLRAAANDATLNIALANGTPNPGITPAATSANTTAGVARTVATALTLYDCSCTVTASHIGAQVTLDANLTGRITAP